MIDWRIDTDSEPYYEKGWYFPTFEAQEMLLPQINVGFDYIDEYDGTTFTAEDCKRIKGNIEYLIDSGIYERRKEVKFDSFESGLVTIPCSEIHECLLKLHEATDQTIKRNSLLRFYGD